MGEKHNQKLQPLTNSYMTLTDSASATLQKAILEGIYSPGSQLPPEVELVKQLGISRPTLREALKRLEEQGLIIRQRGLGTYVREKSIIKDLSINFGISEMIREGGQTPGTKWVDIQEKDISGEPAQALGLSDNTKMIYIERIRLANEKPVVISIDYLPISLFGENKIEKLSLENKSLYQYLLEDMKIRIVNGFAKITPVLATQDHAKKLNIKLGDPLLRIAQTDFSAIEHPILYSVEYHLPNAFIFLVNRKGPHW